MKDLQSTLAEIQSREAARNVEREAAAAANRARVSAWSPEFGLMCDQLKEAGMFGRMIRMEIP